MLTNILDYIRYTLYGALIVTLFFLYQAWNTDHTQAKDNVSEVQNSIIEKNSSYVPQITESTKNKNVTTDQVPPFLSSTNIIHVTTDIIKADIDAIGGNIIKLELLNYPEQIHSKKPFVLMNDTKQTLYFAQSGLLGIDGPDNNTKQALYSYDLKDYSLSPGEDELQVKLHWKNEKGLIVTKLFTFKRNSYEIKINYLIDNQSNQPWNGNYYLQLLRTNKSPDGSKGFASYTTYFGAAISSPNHHYEKISFDKMMKSNLDESITSGWAAMVQHYFVSAWIPDKDLTMQYFTRNLGNNLFAVTIVSPSIDVPAGKTITTEAKLYAGPATANKLEKAAPYLQLTIDYGWFWFISIIIFWAMEKIYLLIGNWGWSIVIITLLIKLLFYHFSAKSYYSMSAMKKLQPRLSALREKYGADKAKFTQAMLELYKKEKVNPFGGCLPILIQIPVFIGLYWVLIESVELRHAPFMFWIQDLSAKDPFYVFPVLMGAFMYLQQRLNPPPPDPLQAKVMMLMPVFITLLFLNLPAGLTLYGFVNNAISYLQQWYIMRNLEKKEKVKKKM